MFWGMRVDTMESWGVVASIQPGVDGRCVRQLNGNHLMQQIIKPAVLSVAALAIIMLAGCPMQDGGGAGNENTMNDNGDVTGGGGSTGTDGGGASDNSGGDVGMTTNDNQNVNDNTSDGGGDVGMNDNAGTDNGGGQNGNGSDDNSNTNDNATDPGNLNDNGGSGGGVGDGGGGNGGGGTGGGDGGNDNGNGNGNDNGSGGGVGLPPVEDPCGVTGTACSAVVTGIGSNPGDGNGGDVVANVTFDGPTGSGTVFYAPTLSIFDASCASFNAGLSGTINFGCPQQINLGVVSFEDAAGNITTAGEVVFDRGVDFACGQAITITFIAPCSVDLSSQ